MGVKIKLKTVTLILLLLVANVSFLMFYTCAYNTDDCKDYGQVNFIDIATIDGKEHTLLMRQTGFQEKVQFLLLYPHNVVFDSCGKPMGDKIATEMIDYFAGTNDIVQWPEIIEIKNKQILIHYTKDVKKSKPLVDVPVIWH
ncbi:MAG: hypothetical protein GY705_21870 [Bacteroidetes bacterium]|nr:hypothetical protein [Bacteroidota bacterium]